MICLFHLLCKKQHIPQCGFFFVEKALLEESYEPSLDKLRWPGIFWFLCSRKQLYIPIYVVLSLIVQGRIVVLLLMKNPWAPSEVIYIWKYSTVYWILSHFFNDRKLFKCFLFLNSTNKIFIVRHYVRLYVNNKV